MSVIWCKERRGERDNGQRNEVVVDIAKGEESERAALASSCCYFIVLGHRGLGPDRTERLETLEYDTIYKPFVAPSRGKLGRN